jgi:ferredoxin
MKSIKTIVLEHKKGRRILLDMIRDVQAAKLSDETAKKAMDICPVGAILKKEVGFAVPVGKMPLVVEIYDSRKNLVDRKCK